MPSWPTCVRMDEPQICKFPCVLRYTLKVDCCTEGHLLLVTPSVSAEALRIHRVFSLPSVASTSRPL